MWNKKDHHQPCQNTEVQYEWSYHTVLLTDLTVRTTMPWSISDLKTDRLYTTKIVLTERVPSLWADFLAWHTHFFAEVPLKFLQPSFAAVAMASPFWSGLAPESCRIQALGIIWEGPELNWIGWGWWIKCKSYWPLSSRGPRGTHY